MYLILLFLSFGVFAASDSKDAYEKSYPRDNTFCTINGKRIEFLIRGGSKFTEPSERGYGEVIFYKLPSKKPALLRSQNSGESYRIFPGKNSICSKSSAYVIDPSTVAVLFLKENHPFKDKLVIQLLDAKSLMPKDFIETEYPTDESRSINNGFAFRKVIESSNLDFGKVSIEGEIYIFQERIFPIWLTYSKQNFKITEETTFDELPWKSYFKSLKDFLEYSEWKPKEKQFIKKTAYLAVNHKLKKECVLFIENKQKLTGDEPWRCYTK